MVGISSAELGRMFKMKRKTLGITANVLEEHSGISATHYRMMERGITIIKDPVAIAHICKTLCDDGTLMACWSIAYLKLQFFNQGSLDTAINFFKMGIEYGPMHMEYDYE